MLPDHLEFKFLEQRLQVLTLKPNPANSLITVLLKHGNVCSLLAAVFIQHNDVNSSARDQIAPKA